MAYEQFVNNVALVPVVAALSRGKYVWSINRAWLVIESKSARHPRTQFVRPQLHAREITWDTGVCHAFPLPPPSFHHHQRSTTTFCASFHSFIPNGWQRNRVVRLDATTRILYCPELRSVMLESCTYGRSCGQFVAQKLLPRINHWNNLYKKYRCAL